jgi:hypothetical protein
MLRHIVIASAVMFAASALAPTSASAGGGHGHRYHGHSARHLHVHVVPRPHVRCWRRVFTRFGYRRVWVCR